MIKVVIGLILLLIPFLLIIKFKDKCKGFFYILSFLISFHLIVAIVTQLFGVFNYTIIILINIVLCILVLIKTDYKKLKENILKIKIDWILIIVISIIFIELYSVHFNYSGKISTIAGVEEVKNMKYLYPYYSDEWSAYSFVQYSLNSGKLPFVNPLWKEVYFPNPEFAFHSFLSNISILLFNNIDGLFSILAILFGITICLLVYFILRFNKIEKFPSAIASLSIPYIVNGANLPGIWYAIPVVLGVICLLLSFILMSFKDSKMVLFTSFLTLIFYPPLFVLSFFSLFGYFIFLDISKKEKLRYFGIYFLICLITAFIISFKMFFTGLEGFSFIEYIFSKLYYFTFTKDSIPDYSIWKIIPFWSLIFAIFGLIVVFNKKNYKDKLWIFMPILIGLTYWIVYSFVFWRFIIEFQRVVFATSVLIVLFSGFGMNFFINYFKNKGWINEKSLEILFVLILITFLFFSFFYTERDNWDDLKLYSNGNRIADPAPPANRYLIEEDLELFNDFEKAVILTHPWKGLVLGAFKNLYPLESKQSTITNSILKYNDFISSDCKLKSKLADKYKINYVYSSEFNCPNFKFIGKSKEGFFLYNFAS